MTAEEREQAMTEYLAYLAHDRLPSQVPRSKAEMQAFIAAADERHRTNPYPEAWEVIWDLTNSSPAEAWQFLLEVISRCEEGDLSQVGAGELESFVHVQGASFADQIIAEIASSTRFRTAFGSVYMGQDFPELIGRQINAALAAAGAPPGDIIDWWSSPKPRT